MSEARPSTGGAEFDDILRDFAVADYAFDAAKRAGLLSPAEARAYEARRAHLIERIDEARGTKPVSYAMFRAALDQGADCEVLYGLRNRMDPKDPLKEDANSDLRSVGCHTSKATRGDRS